MVKDLESRVQRELHLSFEDFLKTRNQTRDELRAEMRPRAERRLRQGLLIGEIARREGVEASDAEVRAEIEVLVGEFGEQAETARKVFEHPNNMEQIGHDLVSRKVVAHLVSIAKGEAGEPPSAEAPAVEAPSDEAPATEVAATETPAEAAPADTAVELPVTDVMPEAPVATPAEAGSDDATTQSIG
jgi:trigger factor